MSEFAIAVTKRKPPRKNEREDQMFAQFAELMISKLESMEKANWEKPWFCTGGFPHNLNHRYYNGDNSMFLLMVMEQEGYAYPIFMTKHNMRELNLSLIDKEQKPVMVTLNNPVYVTESGERLTFKKYKELSEEEQKQCKRYNNRMVWDVFNIDQTNLKDVDPEKYQKLTAEYQTRPHNDDEFKFEPIDKMIADNLWLCPIYPKRQDKAFFSPSKNYIVVPLKEQFKTAQGFYGTLTHEMAHSTGAKNCLDRIKFDTWGDDKYAKEELIAEMTSAIVCQQHGFAKNIKSDSIPYLKSWLSGLKEEPKFIRDIMFNVKQAAQIINSKIEEVAAKKQ